MCYDRMYRKVYTGQIFSFMACCFGRCLYHKSEKNVKKHVFYTENLYYHSKKMAVFGLVTYQLLKS